MAPLAAVMWCPCPSQCTAWPPRPMNSLYIATAEEDILPADCINIMLMCRVEGELFLIHHLYVIVHHFKVSEGQIDWVQIMGVSLKVLIKIYWQQWSFPASLWSPLCLHRYCSCSALPRLPPLINYISNKKNLTAPSPVITSFFQSHMRQEFHSRQKKHKLGWLETSLHARLCVCVWKWASVSWDGPVTSPECGPASLLLTAR